MSVQTVLGTIDSSDLGTTLVHEHLFVSFPGAEFDPDAVFDRDAVIAMAADRLRQLREEHGLRSFVDPCPVELGRDVTLMAEVSERSGVNIICTTGFYLEAMGMPFYWRAQTAERIAEFYIHEITRSAQKSSIRAGAIKVATGLKTISALEHKFIEAACIAQRATGVPIITHTEGGSCGPEQLAAFVAGGVEPHRCLIGHCCANPDHGYHRSIVEGSAYIGFDRIGSVRHQPDEVRADNIVRLAGAGFQQQVLLSQDRHCFMQGRLPVPIPAEVLAAQQAMKARGTWPEYTYLFTDFIPMLEARGLFPATIESMLVDNPRRFFAGEPPARQDNQARQGSGETE